MIPLEVAHTFHKHIEHRKVTHGPTRHARTCLLLFPVSPVTPGHTSGDLHAGACVLTLEAVTAEGPGAWLWSGLPSW